jgi:hypothetical protein
LAEGTRDARLFYHAAVIAGKAGRTQDAEIWLTKAAPLMPLLLPSERERLLGAARQFRAAEEPAMQSSAETTDIFAPAN